MQTTPELEPWLLTGAVSKSGIQIAAVPKYQHTILVHICYLFQYCSLMIIKSALVSLIIFTRKSSISKYLINYVNSASVQVSKIMILVSLGRQWLQFKHVQQHDTVTFCCTLQFTQLILMYQTLILTIAIVLFLTVVPVTVTIQTSTSSPLLQHSIVYSLGHFFCGGKAINVSHLHDILWLQLTYRMYFPFK